ncbi:MAG: M50 family metallopeptidase [Lachnospiraceae bacterium]|nr:M50 family metallopeptidase [Lachnospiraceae bacterium]
MADILNSIHENMFLYSLALAVLVPVLVIVVGYAINLLQLGLAELLALFLDPWWVEIIVNYLFFPGVMLHELSHAFMALITGARLTEVKLFKKEGKSLGHIAFNPRGSKIMISIQEVFISSAPMYFGAMIVFAAFKLVLLIPWSAWLLKIFAGYIGVSMFFHMTMSTQDVKVFVKGIPIIMILVFAESLLLNLFGVIG